MDGSDCVLMSTILKLSVLYGSDNVYSNIVTIIAKRVEHFMVTVVERVSIDSSIYSVLKLKQICALGYYIRWPCSLLPTHQVGTHSIHIHTR